MATMVRFTLLLLLTLSFVFVSATTTMAHVQNTTTQNSKQYTFAALEKISLSNSNVVSNSMFDLFSMSDSLRSYLGTLYGNKPKIDSSRISKILAIKGRNDDYEVTVEIAQDQSRLDFGAYNLFGKKVLDIYVSQTYEKAGIRTYTFNTSGIPNGMYLCVVQGNNFRIAEKFQISR